MTGPYLPSASATEIAREHVLWVQLNDHGTGPGAFLAASLIGWPHEREPSWSDVVLILAAWCDQARAGRPYRHDRRVILLSERRAA